MCKPKQKNGLEMFLLKYIQRSFYMCFQTCLTFQNEILVCARIAEFKCLTILKSIVLTKLYIAL